MSDPKHIEKVAAIKAAADALDAQGMKEADTAYWHCRKTGQGRNRSLRHAVAAYLRHEASHRTYMQTEPEDGLSKLQAAIANPKEPTEALKTLMRSLEVAGTSGT